MPGGVLVAASAALEPAVGRTLVRSEGLEGGAVVLAGGAELQSLQEQVADLLLAVRGESTVGRGDDPDPDVEVTVFGLSDRHGVLVVTDAVDVVGDLHDDALGQAIRRDLEGHVDSLSGAAGTALDLTAEGSGGIATLRCGHVRSKGRNCREYDYHTIE